LITELRRIVEAFDAAGVVYALAGGLAVSIYAAPRATQAIDILTAVSDLDRVITPLGRAGFRTAGRPMTVAGGGTAPPRSTPADLSRARSDLDDSGRAPLGRHSGFTMSTVAVMPHLG
jgi:hypothetical protein